MNDTIRALELSKFAHWQHEPANFDHAVNVARRVANDPRGNNTHIATAYLQSIGHTARITRPDMIIAGIPARVVRAVTRLEHIEGETFLAFLRRVSDHEDTALVAYHDFEERLQNLPEEVDSTDDVIRRLRIATADLNESINRGVPKSG